MKTKAAVSDIQDAIRGLPRPPPNAIPGLEGQSSGRNETRKNMTDQQPHHHAGGGGGGGGTLVVELLMSCFLFLDTC
jgi:hypothetical protein